MLQLHTNRLISPNNLLYDFGSLESNELGKPFFLGGGGVIYCFLYLCVCIERGSAKSINTVAYKGVRG